MIPPPAALVSKLREVVVHDHAPGVTAMVLRDGQLLYRVDIGDIDPGAQFPIASASKWVAAALVLSVVDEGKLALDEPVGQRLPEFTGEAGKITLRQLLSFTSGQGSIRDLFDIRQDPHITLAEAVVQIAARPLEDQPGAVFKYGSPALQVAGRLAEQATGKPWAALFDERIGKPLGLKRTYWSGALRPDLDPATVRNPNLQGGLVTTADDYARFLTMLAAGGIYEGRQILSPAAVEALETAQTLNKPKVYLPPGAARLGEYALGNWCEAVTSRGSCTVVSSAGALGTFPWIDRGSGVYGIFFMRYWFKTVAGDLRQARRIILDNVPPNAVPRAP